MSTIPPHRIQYPTSYFRSTAENAQLFYDVRNKDLAFTDATGALRRLYAIRHSLLLFATALLPPAMMTLASLNPNLQGLRLDLCGRITCAVVEHFATNLTSLTRIELAGPFLVRPPAWQALFIATAGRLQGFLITQSPRFDLECLQSLLKHSGETLTELRLAETGQLKDDWVETLVGFTKLTSLDLSYSANSLTDEAVMNMLSIMGSELRILDLSGHIALTDSALVNGIAPHARQLQSLTLSTLELLTDEGVAQFFQTFTSNTPLRHLDLSRNHELSEKTAEQLLLHSGAALETLNLNSWKDIPGYLLLEMPKQLPCLTSIDLGFCRETDDYVVKAFLESCKELKSLKCFGCNRVTNNCPRMVRNFEPPGRIADFHHQRNVRIFGNEAHTAN